MAVVWVRNLALNGMECIGKKALGRNIPESIGGSG
jgi:hypothetical protein